MKNLWEVLFFATLVGIILLGRQEETVLTVSLMAVHVVALFLFKHLACKAAVRT